MSERERSVALSPRKENVREKKEVASIAVQFELDQIIQHFRDSLEDINKQFAIADDLSNEGKEEEAKDIWRSLVVFTEGIMDFYLHEISKYAIVKMFTGKWEKSENYANFPIIMSTVEEGLKNPESTTWLFDRLNAKFSSETYLSPNTMGQQLSLIGMKLDDICKKAFSKEKGKSYIEGKDQLKMLFDRRNQIAHQVDRKHNDAVKEDINHEFVQEAIDCATAFVEAVHKEALNKEM